ncbi:MAG: tetratricopeptide repeat protein [Candidatus Pacebacteria bacterium]|nr:tetratricopeptide repeat protein [Candidatus Paceibacterota bacterium]
MSGNQFIPRMSGEAKQQSDEITITRDEVAGKTLHSIAQYAVIALAGLLPIFFIPGLWASLGFDKTILTIVAGVIVVVTGSLLMLRRQQTVTVLPISLFLFWAFLVAALVSGVLSGDVQDSLRGSVMESQTVSFLGVLALTMTLPLILQGSKIATIKALALFSVSASLVLTYNLTRLIFGAGFLPLNSFEVITISPIGSFNDLAIFSGLVIVISLITLVQLPLKSWLQYLISGMMVISLMMLATVNFFNIWIMVGFFAFLMFLYLLSRDTLFRNPDVTPVKNSRILIIITTLVCLVSAVFIVAGDYAGSKVGELTGIEYVEVRPSTSATIDIAKSVYSENALLGIGPNRFSDAWRQYKDKSINETVFWDTDFHSGSGFTPTLFVNLGLLGGLLIVMFNLSYIYLGYKMLLRSIQNDTYWYYLGSVSFASSMFVWILAYIYVPGITILLLGALFTGLTFVASGALLPKMIKTIPLASNRRLGFLLMTIIIVIVTVSVTVLFSAGKQYVAQSGFNKAQATSESVEVFEQAAITSYGMYQDDRFVSARTQLQLININSLLGVSNPTEVEQQQFLAASEQAILFAGQALAEDATNPGNHAILASVYSSLATVGIEGAQERAEHELSEAERLDPLNPGYRLVAAQMAIRIGDAELAREEIFAALALKRNFTQALYLLAQMEIAEGNTEEAIAATRAIITLEPNNPTRYFQLGLLLSASDSVPEAIAAYSAAISIDYNYANARYLLATALITVGQKDAALEHLLIVQQSNEENEQLQSLIQKVESGESILPPDFGPNAPVNETAPERGFEDSVTTEGEVDTDLVIPVNTISDNGREATEDVPESFEIEVQEEVNDETEPGVTE